MNDDSLSMAGAETSLAAVRGWWRKSVFAGGGVYTGEQGEMRWDRQVGQDWDRPGGQLGWT